MAVYQYVFLLLCILALSSGERCPSNGVPVVNMCSNEVKTGSRLSLDISIKPEDNINNCSCILQFIQPDTEQTYKVTFTPFYRAETWCYYSFTMTHDSTRGRFDCTHQSLSVQFELKPRETVDILLKKEPTRDDQSVTKCMDIQSSDAGTSFTISCSLPNNQSPPTVLTNFISSFTTTDYHTPTNASSTTSTSTIIDVNKTSLPRGEPQTNSNTQKPQVGAIIGGVLGGIVVIGGVVLAILVWRCYRTKISEEDTTYSSLDLHHNINPEDLTYQGLQTNLSSTQSTTSTAENCLTNQAFSTDKQFTSNQSATISQINNSLTLNQPTFTDATDHNLSVTPTYENQSSPIGLTNTDQDSGEQKPNNQHYENLT